MITISAAEPANIDAIADLTDEMDHFYGATELEPREVRIRQIHEALFSDPPAAYALLAWKHSELVGFAGYSFLWPAAGMTRSLFLKELYVTESARQTGIGRRLMCALSEIALKHDCSRLEWTTDQDNQAAQSFYESLGNAPNITKLFYRDERSSK